MAECFWQNLVLTEEDCDAPVAEIPAFGDFIQRAELVGPGPVDYFGRWVAIDAETAMISVSKSPGADDSLADNSCNTVVYTNSGNVWTEGATLSETQTMEVRQVTGDLAVFTTYDDVDTGGVYVYQRSGGTWSNLQLIELPNSGDTILALDAAMSPDGEWLAIGCYNQTDSATNPGYVRMYQWNGANFVYSSQIEAPNAPGVYEYFGYALALSSTGVMLVGAYGNDDSGSNDGQVYVYALSGGSWGLDYAIGPTVNESSTRFGHSVAITADGIGAAIGDRRGGLSTYYDEGSGLTYEQRLDPGVIGVVGAQISDDALTTAQYTDGFAVDSLISINEYDAGWSETQSFSPDHPDLATAWIAIYGSDMRDGQLIIGCAEHETGDGLIDGQGFVYIYSRDPI